jgi:hypothetical protein
MAVSFFMQRSEIRIPMTVTTIHERAAPVLISKT